MCESYHEFTPNEVAALARFAHSAACRVVVTGRGTRAAINASMSSRSRGVRRESLPSRAQLQRARFWVFAGAQGRLREVGPSFGGWRYFNAKRA
jgi:hypothetical protein